MALSHRVRAIEAPGYTLTLATRERCSVSNPELNGDFRLRPIKGFFGDGNFVYVLEISQIRGYSLVRYDISTGKLARINLKIRTPDMILFINSQWLSVVVDNVAYVSITQADTYCICNGSNNTYYLTRTNLMSWRWTVRDGVGWGMYMNTARTGRHESLRIADGKIQEVPVPESVVAELQDQQKELDRVNRVFNKHTLFSTILPSTDGSRSIATRRSITSSAVFHSAGGNVYFIEDNSALRVSYDVIPKVDWNPKINSLFSPYVRELVRTMLVLRRRRGCILECFSPKMILYLIACTARAAITSNKAMPTLGVVPR
jgi:hypothetical protein